MEKYAANSVEKIVLSRENIFFYVFNGLHCVLNEHSRKGMLGPTKKNDDIWKVKQLFIEDEESVLFVLNYRVSVIKSKKQIKSPQNTIIW